MLLTAMVIGLILSGISPRDRLTWFLEIAPVLIGIPILVATYARFPPTPLVYRLLAGHAVILMIGAHYTYAEVPLGRWVQDAFGLARNHYDRLGHFAQGFVPAILARELLLRTSPLQPGLWLFFLVCSVCLAFSASYELFEWGTARALGQSATAFLATQGDEWDTQWDMFLALLGSVIAQVCLSSTHDRQLEALHLRSFQRGRL
jgi:putative membrane protein